MKLGGKKWFAVFVAPTFTAFCIAFLIPFIMGIYLSFCEFRTVNDASFIGIQNYIRAFGENNDFLNSLIFTVKFAVVAIISTNAVAFLLALMLTRGIRGTNVFRTIFFMPNLIGGIVLGYIWQLIINGVLQRYGYAITSNATFGYWGLILLSGWQMIGYMMVLYIAGIQNIPTAILEAARVDGASPIRTLRSIIIPSVMPSVTICLFLTLTNAFKLFDQNLALTAGAPSKQTQMMALDIYNTFYGKVGFEGVGQAKAVVFFIIVASIALMQLYFTKSKEVEQ